MDNLTEIISTGKTIVAVLGFIIAVITTAISNKNSKGKRLVANLNVVRNYTEKFVKLAEEFKDFGGSTKKEWVLTKVNQICIDKNIPFDIDQASNLVEGIVELTKSVNKRDKDQTIKDTFSEV